MFDIEQITAFFGWCSVINIGLLIFTTILLIVLKDFISSVHCRLMGLDLTKDKDKLQGLYMNYLAYYKIAIIMLNITPYFALKLMI